VYLVTIDDLRHQMTYVKTKETVLPRMIQKRLSLSYTISSSRSRYLDKALDVKYYSLKDVMIVPAGKFLSGVDSSCCSWCRVQDLEQL